MLPLLTIDSAHLPGGTEFSLLRRGDEWIVRAAGQILMSSRSHASETALAEHALVQVKTPGSVLIGGLGLGFTLRGVLDRVSSSTRVVVAELVPALIEWNRQHVGHLANHPLQDPRCQIINQDVFEQISGADGAFDAILLDVDNGPAALAETSNQRLYSKRGARHCLASLRPEGVLAVWSAGPSERYRNVLASAGFGVEVLRVPSSTKGRGSHVLFLATARPLHPGRGMINGAT